MSESPRLPRPKPTPSRDSAFFWEGVSEGKLLAQQCSNCHALRHPPRPMCPSCGSTQWEALTLSGHGTVHSWIEPVHPKLPFFEEPLLVALIDLEEGPRLLSNLCDVKPEDVITGMEVEVFFVPSDPGAKEDQPVHQFRPRKASR